MSGDRFYLRKILPIIATALAIAVFGGCASNQLDSVPSSASSTVQTLDLGTVIAVRDVNIEGESTNLGTYGGGVMGSAIGSTVGSGDGRIIAAAAGSVVGAVVGEKIEKELTKKIAQEITVEMDDGGTIVVVQERVEPIFSAGDRVSLLETRTGHARVRHEDATAYYIP